MDASRSIADIEADLLSLSLDVIKECGVKPMASLWTTSQSSIFKFNDGKIDDKENVYIDPNRQDVK